MSPLLDDKVLSHIGKSEPPQKELATRRDIRKYSVATGQRLRKYLDGDEAPPLFHIALFWDIVPLDGLCRTVCPSTPCCPNFRSSGPWPAVGTSSITGRSFPATNWSQSAP